MKQININNFKEKLYYEKFENGFEVYLVPKKDKKNYTTFMGVKYGGRNINFNVDGKTHHVPTGIAHFLEHKMFETENNPFEFYQKTGTEVNASTTYEFTGYYIFGNSYYNKNLRYLLKWLKKLNLTQEQVTKEQGIILEEANMYKDSPDRVLMEKLKENVFVNDPYRNKVIGTDDDIKSITKEEIELCYNTFYTADNMFLISVGNFDPNKAMEIIKEEIKDYKKNKNKIEKCYGDEPDEVSKEYEEIKMNVDIPRIAVAYKINKKELENLNISKFKLDLYLQILIDGSLGLTSDIREKWLKENLFIKSFYRITEAEKHYIIEFSAISNKPDELYKELEKYLQDIKIEKDVFERQKKLWIASEVKNVDNIQNLEYSILHDVLNYEKFICDKINQIKDLKYEKVEEIKENLKFDKKVIVKIV